MKKGRQREEGELAPKTYRKKGPTLTVASWQGEGFGGRGEIAPKAQGR